MQLGLKAACEQNTIWPSSELPRYKILAQVSKCRPDYSVIISHMEHNEKCIDLQQFSLNALKGRWADGRVCHTELDIMWTGLNCA
jgi:hypothetical protein